MQLDVPVYWINMDASAVRRSEMEQQLAHAAAVHTRVQAATVERVRSMLASRTVRIEGSTVLVDRLSAREPHVRHRDQQVVLPEVACTLSHLIAMSRAVEADSSDAVLVLEDDMNVSWARWRLPETVLQLARRAPADWEVLQLHSKNSWKYGSTLCREDQLFVPWARDHWSTGAYLISHAAMRRMLNATWASGTWTLPSPVVADHMLYARMRTYTLTRPIFSTSTTSRTAIQTAAAENALRPAEQRLWASLQSRRDWCSLPSSAAPAPSLLVITSATLREREVQRGNGLVVAAAFGRAARMTVVCVDRRCDAWESVRADLAGAGLRVSLVDDPQPVGTYRSKFLSQVQAFRRMRALAPGLGVRVLLLDGDVGLAPPGFDLHRFVSASADATLTQPIVSGNSQFFPPLNADYWTPARRGVFSRCVVPVVEQQVVLTQAPFFEWFITSADVQGLLDLHALNPTGWGYDFLWCGAAREFNASSAPCVVDVSQQVQHHNTKAIRKDDRFFAAGQKALRALRSRRWMTRDPRKLGQVWERTGLNACTAGAFTLDHLRVAAWQAAASAARPRRATRTRGAVRANRRD